MVNRITDLYDVIVLIVSVLSGKERVNGNVSMWRQRQKLKEMRFKFQKNNTVSQSHLFHSLEFHRIMDHGVIVSRPVVQRSGMCLNHALYGDIIIHGHTDQLVRDLQHRRD